ncbi:hypothetical protein D3C87_1815320 [compost metagenome]
MRRPAFRGHGQTAVEGHPQGAVAPRLIAGVGLHLGTVALPGVVAVARWPAARQSAAHLEAVVLIQTTVIADAMGVIRAVDGRAVAQGGAVANRQ